MSGADGRPERAGAVLAVLLLGAAVANINMSVADTAVVDIAVALDADQNAQNLMSISYMMALAATVLYLGAVGDRYGRRRLLVTGAALSVPCLLVSAFAPSIGVLVVAQLCGGVTAAMMFPTTLSIISVLWSGPSKGRAIAIWSGVGGCAAFLGSVVAGVLLQWFWWGSVFVFAVPFAALVAFLGWRVVPADTDLERQPVDHLGGALSFVGLAALVFGVSRISTGLSVSLVVYLTVGAVAIVLFLRRERRAPWPLLDLTLARHDTFWVAAVAGAISFGALMGSFYVGQQFTRNVLQYDALQSALATLPAAAFFLAMSAPAAAWMRRRGGRSTLMMGIAAMGVGFLVMGGLWAPGASLWVVLLPYAVLGCGVAFAGAAASTALMSSLPGYRAGMGSAVTDLTRDFGGAFVQAVMASVLTVSYSGFMMASFEELPAEEAERVGQTVARSIAGSFQTAEEVASGFPEDAAAGLMSAAEQGFSGGKSWALLLAVLLVLGSLTMVWLKYPRKDEEDAAFAAARRLQPSPADPAGAAGGQAPT